MNDNLFVSFSGGKTSAYMTYKILNSSFKDRYKNIVVCFANTGEEHPNTLKFINNCDKILGFNTTWLEAVINPEMGKGVRSKIVSYETASKLGEPFEDMCAKYGIPNMSFPHCTKYLKQYPLHHYVRSVLGWEKNYDTAIGIRIDEQRRVTKNKDIYNVVYPLIDWFPSDKVDVNDFWEDMPFTLDIDEHQGNCKWCWKKSLTKHFKNIQENPEWYEFPKKLESRYSSVKTTKEGKPLALFRGHKTTIMLLQEFSEYKQSNQLSLNFNEDLNGGCSESCEVYGTD